MTTEKEQRALWNAMPDWYREEARRPGLARRIFDPNCDGKPEPHPEMCPERFKYMGRNDDGNLERECGYLHIDLT